MYIQHNYAPLCDAGTSGNKAKGTRKTGTAYRRAMTRKHNTNLAQLLRKVYIPHAAYVKREVIDGVWVPVGKFIKYPNRSRRKQYLKNRSNRAVRRRKEIFRGNQYRKCYEYWDMLT